MASMLVFISVFQRINEFIAETLLFVAVHFNFVWVEKCALILTKRSLVPFNKIFQ